MADGKDKGAKSDGGDDLGGQAALALLGLGLVALVVVPVVGGYVLYLTLRAQFGKKENYTLAALSAAGLVWRARYCFRSYATWLSTLVHGHVALTGVPWLALLLMSGFLAGVLGVVSATSAVTKFGRVLAPTGTVVHQGRRGRGRRGLLGRRGGRTGTPAGAVGDILPDLDVRQSAHRKSSLARPPGSALTVAANLHSVLDPQEPGKRSFPLGVALDGSPVTLSEGEIRTHGLILGSTGSGKSETIKALAGNLLDLGWSGIVLDLKEDTAKDGLRDWCFEYATHHSTPYQELCLSNPQSETWFNPLSGMGPDEMRDTILSLNEFEAAYYEALNKELLGQIVMLMTWAHEVDPSQFATPTMYDIAKLCSNPSMSSATKKMRAVVQAAMPHIGEEDFRVLVSPSKAQQESAVGFGSRLGNLYDSQAGRVILRAGSALHGIPRRQLDVTLPGLTYIGLDSQGKPDLTRVISSSVLQRLSVYAAHRTTGRAEKERPRFVIIDEANWINRGITQNLLSRARGAGISMWLCTQGPKDWIDKDGDDWGKLTNNINVAVIMRQGDPESAELCSELLGKQITDKVSEKVTQTNNLLGGPRAVRGPNGKIVESFTVSSDWDYQVAPDRIRAMTIGEAIVRVGAPVQRLEYVRIAQRDAKASPRR